MIASPDATRPFSGEKSMLDAHLTYIVIIFDIKSLCEGAAFFALLGALYVLVRNKMIHNESYFLPVEDIFKARPVKLADGDGAGDVVGKHHIELRFDELSRLDLRQTCMRGENFLCHCHSHIVLLSLFDEVDSFIHPVQRAYEGIYGCKYYVGVCSYAPIFIARGVGDADVRGSL